MGYAPVCKTTMDTSCGQPRAKRTPEENTTEKVGQVRSSGLEKRKTITNYLFPYNAYQTG